MPAPGYYKTSFQALRLRETIRRWGLLKGVRYYLRTRRMRPSAGGTWMPGLWAEMECKPEDLSEEFWLATKPHRKDFEQLGFVQCRLARTKSLNPTIRETGGVNYLDSTRCHFGKLSFLRVFRRARGVETNEIIIAFTAAFENDRTFTCTNQKKLYDPVFDSEIVHIDSYDVNFIYRQFLERLQQRKETPRSFPDLESFRQWFDVRQIKAFEERVRRGLYVPMTEREIAAARAQQEGRSAATKLVFPRSFGLRWGLWVIIIGGMILLNYGHQRLPHNRPGTIEYHGQEFKMRKDYPTYEDYKDDPNNLDTNELDRIEQAIVSVKVPESFANREEFVDFMISELKFPGYGVGAIGEHPKADDGTRLDVETVEIPQKEDRVLTVKQSGEQFILIDDFIYSTATNHVTHVKLKDKVLHYYDAENQLIREKPL